MSKLILALDPGKMSGWAYLNRETMQYESGELDFLPMSEFIHNVGETHGSDVVMVSESFIIGQQTVKNTQAPWSLEMIGVMRHASQRYTGRDVHLQAPASAKRFSSNERLQHMGWYVPGKGHANDASRHLLLLMAERGWLPTETLRELATSNG